MFLRRVVVLASILGVAAVLGSCFRTADQLPPEVVATEPADGATDVSPDTVLSATFSEPVEPTSVGPESFVVETAADQVSGSVSCDDMVATFTPDEPFGVADTVTATITTGVHDPAGNVLVEPYGWSFTTADREWGTAVYLDDTSDSCDYVSGAAAGDGMAAATWLQGTGDVAVCTHTPAGWTAPLVVDSGGGDIGVSRVAVNAAGKAAIAWIQSDGAYDQVYASVYDGVSSWTAEEHLSTGGSHTYEARLAMDSSGNVVVVWRQDDDIWFCEYTDSTTTWSAASATVVENDAAAANKPQVAFADDDSLCVTWRQDFSPYDVRFRRRTPGGAWGSVETADTEASYTTDSPELAVDGDGNAFVVWKQYDGSRDRAYGRRYLAASNAWEASPALLDDGSAAGSALFPRVAAGPNGTAIAVWRQLSAAKRSVYVNVYTPGSGWSGAELIEDNDANDCESHDVAVDADGNAVAVWQLWDGSVFRAWSSRFAAGDWQTPEIVDLADGHAWTPYIYADDAGRVLAVWSLQPPAAPYDIRGAWFE
jgi:hypothetical protein